MQAGLCGVCSRGFGAATIHKERRKAGCVGDAIQQSVPQCALLKNLNDVVIASQCSQHPGAVRRLSRIVRLKAAAYVHYRCSASHWPWHALFHVLSLGTDTESSLLLLCHFCCLRHASPRPGLQAKPAQAQMPPVGYYLWRTRHSCSARAVDTLILTATCIGHIPRSS